MRGSLARALGIAVAIVSVTVATAVGVTYAITIQRTPQYRSVARLLITPNSELYEGRDLLAGLEALERTSIQATYEEVLNSSRILSSARAAVPLGNLDPDDFEIRSLALPSADLIEVTVEGPSATLVADLANETVSSGLTFLRQRYPMYVLEVLDVAVPAIEPFEPNLLRDLAISVVIGAALGLAVFLLVYRSPAPETTRADRHERDKRPTATVFPNPETWKGSSADPEANA